MKNKNEDFENKTLEDFLLDLRLKKKWTYLNIANELYKLGVTVSEKDVKKWELGLSYPDLDMIYKLSELYFVSSEQFLIAKKNSYLKGYNSFFMTIVKLFCYLTGFTLRFGYILCIIFITFSLIGALLFFVSQVNIFIN